MTVQEIKNRKKELSIKIAEEIIKFEKETNVEVTGLCLDVSVAKNRLGEVWDRRISVDVSLKNPYSDGDN